MGRDLSDSQADSPGCEGATARRCPHHAVAALNDITGGPVDWVGSEGLNEWERKALELSEERANSAMASAVLRSWEARFGARLLTIDPGRIQLLAECSPRTSPAAQHLAAEHFAFCDECGGQGLRYVSAIAASLENAPLWTFWWD